ncbi:MAG: hypothetical protein ACYSTY_13235 [Planctomycetota bacterium]
MLTALAVVLCLGSAAPGQDPVQAVLRELNSHKSIHGTEESKSYRILFDAYLELTPPPFKVGELFNQTTIHPGMRGWSAVTGWAESNPAMAEAILKCKDKGALGLPYGVDEVPRAYREEGLVAAVGVDGSLRNNQFRYLPAVDTIAAFATAETYRRLEAGSVDAALDLAMAHIFVLRQFCDRGFLAEKLYHLPLLTEALINLRDIFYRYQDQIAADRFVDISWQEIPFLRPDWKRFEMPEADRVVSEALIREVFDERTGQADRERFATTFAAIQSEDAALTRFGAAARWRMIAEVHGSLDASLERLGLIYDDWWRRWRIVAYDPLLELPTQFDTTNEVRYAAVIYSMQNIEILFEVRKRLKGAINGVGLAAGLCGYKSKLGTYPSDPEKMYAQYVRKFSDADPYNPDGGAFRYLLPSRRHSIDTAAGRLWVEPGQCILYSVGRDARDDRASQHSSDGAIGDVVIWPPIRLMAREQGLIK